MSGPLGSSQWMYASGFEAEQSLKFDDTKAAHLTFTPASAGNRRTFTFSAWIKRGLIQNGSILTGGADNNNAFRFRFNGAALQAYDYNGSSNQYDWAVETNADLRDPAAWYHVMLAVDTTQGTNTNRIKLYINGTQQTDLATASYPSQNYDTEFNQAIIHRLGETHSVDSATNGYLAEVYLLDGVVGTPSDFGETGSYGEWKPKLYTGSFGTNGWYLPFKNDYTVEGFSATVWKNAAPMYVGGIGFKADLIWTKSRAEQGHAISDIITGFDKYGQTNGTADFYTAAEIDQNLNPTADGFTSNGGWHSAGHSYVSWAWDMGADTPTGFGCRVYTGNASATMIGGFGFQPDLLWIKNRNDAASSNVGNVEIFDAIRGPKEILRGNTTGAEIEEAAVWGVDRFTTDGFNLSNQGYYGNVNVNDKTFVAWGWDMGGTTAANTTGSIDSTVMANTAKGQSIVSWTGTGATGTVGHGLSSAPELIILKNRDDTANWGVFHKDLNDGTDSGEYNLFLNTNGAEASGEGFWNDTVPASTVFSVGSANQANGSSDKMIAYCFHSVSGYSSVGSYTGNANTTGPSVTTGFRPAFILFKKEAAGANWFVIDNARGPFNTIKTSITIDNAQNESYAGTTAQIDFNDNGFQIKASNNDVNANNVKYRYIAFAGGLDSISTYSTAGTIDSRFKANTTYGQSIVSYIGTGATGTVAHGLGGAPEFVIIKRKDAADNWVVQRQTGNILTLQTNNAEGASDNFIQTLGSSTFTLGDGSNTPDSAVCADGGEYLAYCWRSITGYSKIGTYTGNGDGDGPTVTLGFQPAFLLIKPSSAQDHWNLYDSTRSPINGSTKKLLFPNRNNAEADSSQNIDFSSTGFQLKSDNSGINGDGITYLYLAFADKREYAYWLDQSGNNNDWTSVALTESDIMLDNPSNNFCTLTPSDETGGPTFTEGNLKVSVGDDFEGRGTIYVDSGKWYCEMYVDSIGNNGLLLGISVNNMEEINALAANNGVAYFSSNGNKYVQASGASYGAAYIAGDIIGIALDQDNHTVNFYKNNVAQGALTIPTDSHAFSVANSGTASKVIVNFGQDSSFAGANLAPNATEQGNQDSGGVGDFYYEPPSGFLALCTKNLPEPTVTPSEHFNTVLYSGNGSAQAISGVGFQPDWVWLKRRSSVQNNNVFDSVRGTNKVLATNTTDAEGSVSQFLNSFDSDGFTVGSAGNVSQNGETNVAFNWYAPTSFSNDASATSVGSADSSGKVNAAAGFSIISYVGTSGPDTIAHGLSATPEMIIVKNRSADGQEWLVYHHKNTAAPATDYLRLDATSVTADNTFWNDTAPTSTVFSVGDSQPVNSSHGNSYIAYCFHSVEGYSKVGSYKGNDAADGAFVYCGFKPAFVLIKNTILDGEGFVYMNNKTDPDNVVGTYLTAYSTAAEQGSTSVTHSRSLDFVSNGFKLRGNSTEINDSEVIVFYAVAERPFKYSHAG